MSQQLLEEVIALKIQADAARDAYEAIKGELDFKRQALLHEMSAAGIKTQEDPSKRYTLSRGERVDVRLVNEDKVLDWITHQPNLEADFYVGLKWDRFKPIARVALKKDGEVVPGIETDVSEYLTIRKKDNA